MNGVRKQKDWVAPFHERSFGWSVAAPNSEFEYRSDAELATPDAYIPEPVSRATLASFLNRYGLVHHHIQSFNQFFMRKIPNAIRDFALLRFFSEEAQRMDVITFVSPQVHRPRFREPDGTVHAMTVEEARARKATYQGEVSCRIIHDVYEVKDGHYVRGVEPRGYNATGASKQGPSVSSTSPQPAASSSTGASAHEGGEETKEQVQAPVPEASGRVGTTVLPTVGVFTAAPGLVGLRGDDELVTDAEGGMFITERRNKGVHFGDESWLHRDYARNKELRTRLHTSTGGEEDGNGVREGEGDAASTSRPRSRTASFEAASCVLGGDGSATDSSPNGEHVARVMREDGVGEDWVLSVELDRAEAAVDPRFKRVERVISDQNEVVNVPCMIGSEMCYTRDMPESATSALDRIGGGFVTNGADKRPMAQLTRRPNMFMVFESGKNKDGRLQYDGEIRALVESKDRSTGTLQLHLTTGPRCTGFTHLSAHINYFNPRNNIPIFALFRLLGSRSVREVARMIAWGGRVAEDDVERFPERPETKSFELWIQSILSYRPVIKSAKRADLEGILSSSETKRVPDFEQLSWEEVINWVGAYATNHKTKQERLANLRHLVGNELEPQHGQRADSRSLRLKRRAIAFYVWRMLRVARGEDYPDDRDDPANMCLETIGLLLSQTFRREHRYRIKHMLKVIRESISKNQYFNATDKFCGSRTSFMILSAIRYGRAGETYQGGSSTNITNPAEHKNTQDEFSDLRSVYKRGDKSSKFIGSKLLRVGEWGQLGPSHTPEGENNGRCVHLPQAAYVVMGVPFSDIIAPVVDLLGKEITFVGEEPPDWNPNLRSTTPLIINGVFTGYVENPSASTRKLRSLRRKNPSLREVEIVYDPRHGAVYLNALHGTIRVARFVLEPLDGASPGEDFRHITKERVKRIRNIVGNQLDRISEVQWQTLLDEGLVELLSKHEERSFLVRSNPSREREDRYDALEELWDDDDILDEPVGAPICQDVEQERQRRRERAEIEEELKRLRPSSAATHQRKRKSGRRRVTAKGTAKNRARIRVLESRLEALGWYEQPLSEDDARRAVERSKEIREEVDEGLALHWDEKSAERKKALECELADIRERLQRPIQWDIPPAVERGHEIQALEHELYEASIHREYELEQDIEREQTRTDTIPRPRFDMDLDAVLPDREKFAWYRALRSMWACEDAKRYVENEVNLSRTYLPDCDLWRKQIETVWATISKSDEDENAEPRLCDVEKTQFANAFRLFMATCGDAMLFPKAVMELHQRVGIELHPTQYTEALRGLYALAKEHALRLIGTVEEIGEDGIRQIAWSPKPSAKLIRLQQELAQLQSAEVKRGRRYWAELTWRKRIRHRRRLLRQQMDETELHPHGVVCGHRLYTHAELHPTSFMSIVTALAPYVNHNQGARVTFFDAMGASSIESSPPEASDFSIHSVLENGEVPLVQTQGERTLGRNNVSYGVNAIVAIMCWDGRNVEDGVLVSKKFIDRGGLRVMDKRPYSATATQGAKMDDQQFEKPDPTVVRNVRTGSLEKLTEAGHPRVGSRLVGGDYVIGRTNTTRGKNKAEVVKRDTSILVRVGDGPGVVERVVYSNGRDQNKQMTVQTRSVCIPEVGDKLSTRHAQKGVIGEVVPAEDLPFAPYSVPIRDPDTGEVVDVYHGCITPDIIMNPHAFPSRMTHGQVIEMMNGWLAALTGTVGDATAFQTGITAESVSLHLKKHGWSENGEFTMQSGFTGLPLRAKVFMGPVYVMRLAQMASKKIHGRSLGPVTALTRQPVNGRQRQGGNKQGTMERDNFVSYGASQLLWERFVYSSNPYLATFCKQCGFLAEDAKAKPTQLEHLGDVGVGERGPYCRVCRHGDAIARVRIPYVTKQLWFYMASMGIAPRFKITTSREIDFAGQPAPGVYTQGANILITPDQLESAHLHQPPASSTAVGTTTAHANRKRPARSNEESVSEGGHPQRGLDPMEMVSRKRLRTIAAGSSHTHSHSTWDQA